MTPLVSAILPVHNRSAWIARAVSSVLAQTYPSVELIVVDDGSTDDTVGRLEPFRHCVKIVSQTRAGAYAARNRGIAQATGDLIAFIDSDDVWLPSRLSRQVPMFDKPEVGLVFGDARLVGGTPASIVPSRRSCFQITPPARGAVASHFVWGNFVPTSTVVVRRRCFEESGLFAVTQPVSADYLKWFQIAARHELDYVDDGPVADYTVHAGGISQDLGRSLRARIQLFSEELARTDDAVTRDLLRHLLFNLALHLTWAGLRGRAGGVDDFRLAYRTSTVAGRQAPTWMGSFAYHYRRARFIR